MKTSISPKSDEENSNSIELSQKIYELIQEIDKLS